MPPAWQEKDQGSKGEETEIGQETDLASRMRYLQMEIEVVKGQKEQKNKGSDSKNRNNQGGLQTVKEMEGGEETYQKERSITMN